MQITAICEAAQEWIGWKLFLIAATNLVLSRQSTPHQKTITSISMCAEHPQELNAGWDLLIVLMKVSSVGSMEQPSITICGWVASPITITTRIGLRCGGMVIGTTDYGLMKTTLFAWNQILRPHQQENQVTNGLHVNQLQWCQPNHPQLIQPPRHLPKTQRCCLHYDRQRTHHLILQL